MKKICLAVLAGIILQSSCKKPPEAIPLGEWEYDMLINGIKAGSAVLSNKKSDGRYIYTTVMKMKAGDIINETTQIITEALDFKPVKYEVYNRINNGSNVQEIKTIAVFDGKKIDLAHGDSKATLTIARDYIIDGNYFIDQLIKLKFKPGTEIKAYIYEPLIEIDDPIPVTIKVIGWEKVKIHDREIKLLHLTEYIENYKNVDIYLNEGGITEKAVIHMLNNRFELIKR